MKESLSINDSPVTGYSGLFKNKEVGVHCTLLCNSRLSYTATAYEWEVERKTEMFKYLNKAALKYHEAILIFQMPGKLIMKTI